MHGCVVIEIHAKKDLYNVLIVHVISVFYIVRFGVAWLRIRKGQRSVIFIFIPLRDVFYSIVLKKINYSNPFNSTKNTQRENIPTTKNKLLQFFNFF